MTPVHRHPIRVYFEDTDAGGIVYHACYLNFAERARTEMVRALGVSQQAQLEAGHAFAVRRALVDYRRPARLDDLLVVETEVLAVAGARIDLRQRICHDGDGTELVCLEVRLGYITLSGRPARLPVALRGLFETWISERR